MATRAPANPLAMLLDTIQVIREKDAEMTAQAMCVLLYIQLQPGIIMTELQEKSEMGLSTTAVSRNIRKFLTKGGGLGLIRQEEDEEDSRVKHLYLTREGEVLMERLRKTLAVQVPPASV